MIPRELDTDPEPPAVETLPGAPSSPDVSVVIVNYNVQDFLLQTIRSVEAASSSLTVETLVVDNNSVDGSVDAVRKEFPHVHLVVNRENLGFSKANNVGIERATGRYVLILNPDTIIQEDTLDVLVAFMDDNPDAGAVGCKILNPDGSFAKESRRSFPEARVAFYRMIGLSSLFPSSKRFGRYNLTYLPVDETTEVDALSGSCMMVRSQAFDETVSGGRPGPGKFDEDFFMYGEDLDLCYRIQKAGWKIFYVPDTQIIHYKGESTKKGELRYVRLFYGAMLLFIEKHQNPSRSKFLKWSLRTGIWARGSLSFVGHQFRNVFPVLLDFILVYGVVTLIGVLRSSMIDRVVSPLFLISIPPTYAVATILGVSWTGGYKRISGFAYRTAIMGILFGCLAAASVSFFVPGVAFSRLVVILSLPVAGLLMILWRMSWKARHRGPHRAILVGDETEARRLKQLLDVHPEPPFLLAGYAGVPAGTNGAQDDAPVKLGTRGQLRDLVRLKEIREIVFASRSLSNQEIFETIKGLRDKDLQFRILHAGSEHVIGKSDVRPVSISSLLMHLPELVEFRTRFRRRLYEIPVAFALLLMWPIVAIASLVIRTQTLTNLRRCSAKMTRVLSGQYHLVGACKEHLSKIPESWDLQEGVFSVTNTLNTQALNPDDLSRAYWYYVTHQSPGLDTDIILKSIRSERELTR